MLLPKTLSSAFFSNAVKTENLGGIRILVILEDHHLEILYTQHLYRSN